MATGAQVRTIAQPTESATDIAAAVRGIGQVLVRYGLALVLLWIGAMKFTGYEAAGIQPLIQTSPLMSWLNRVLSVQGASNLLGVIEITTGLLLCLHHVWPKAAALGAVLGICTFLTTLTFLFSLPGWEQTLGGFPALSGNGGFLLKDVVLLGASVFALGESLEAIKS
jgi:uncharacterized membrane protein YkgB